MKNISVALLLILEMLSSFALAKPPRTKTYVEGTVLRVERRRISQSLAGENPSDAPLSDPKIYVYEIAVRVNCETYVGRRETWHETGLVPDQKVQVRLTPSTMYVYRTDEREIKIRILSRHAEGGSCTGN